MSKSIESLLKKYEPNNYKLIIKPLEKVETKYKGVGCIGTYLTKYGIDEKYYEEVINADEKVDE